jgi:hypothetical protein|tara:strand:- start:5906 stop:6286 length:381 start_codon:yes stop_codon:yes gene_type:complete
MKKKKDKKKIICFDLDNVICSTKKNNYKQSRPIKKSVKIVNELFSSGFTIKIFTARFMGRNNDNWRKAKSNGYKFTKLQLKKWKVNYHKLIMGKPSYDLIIDDKALGFKKNWNINVISTLRKIKKV